MFGTIFGVFSLDKFKVFLTLAKLRLWDQVWFVTDHVLGQLIDLVGDFANTVNVLFLGLPEVIRVCVDDLKFRIFIQIFRVELFE